LRRADPPYNEFYQNVQKWSSFRSQIYETEQARGPKANLFIYLFIYLFYLFTVHNFMEWNLQNKASIKGKVDQYTYTVWYVLGTTELAE